MFVLFPVTHHPFPFLPPLIEKIRGCSRAILEPFSKQFRDNPRLYSRLLLPLVEVVRRVLQKRATVKLLFLLVRLILRITCRCCPCCSTPRNLWQKRLHNCTKQRRHRRLVLPATWILPVHKLMQIRLSNYKTLCL